MGDTGPLVPCSRWICSRTVLGRAGALVSKLFVPFSRASAAPNKHRTENTNTSGSTGATPLVFSTRARLQSKYWVSESHCGRVLTLYQHLFQARNVVHHSESWADMALRQRLDSPSRFTESRIWPVERTESACGVVWCGVVWCRAGGCMLE